MTAPGITTRHAELNRQDRPAEAHYSRLTAQARRTARPADVQDPFADTVHRLSAWRTLYVAILSVLIDRRAQAAAAVVLAIIAGLLLGSHNASAGLSTSPSSPYHRH